jgi:hypothetical protein
MEPAAFTLRPIFAFIVVIGCASACHPDEQQQAAADK